MVTQRDRSCHAIMPAETPENQVDDISPPARYTELHLPARIRPLQGESSMISFRCLCRFAMLLAAALPLLALTAGDVVQVPDRVPPPRLELRNGDHISIIGNTLAERCQ